MSAARETIDISDDRFDFSSSVDAMRCHPNAVLRDIVKEARVQQERWWLRELAATRVLDEREALGPLPDAAQSTRTNTTNLKVARELESLPEIAAAAHDGTISRDQLSPLVEVATPETDVEWARKGSRTPANDLSRMARRLQKVSATDAEARHQARELRMWRDAERGMALGRWSLPDVNGALVEQVLDHMAERMRPAKGQKWDSLEHRRADALVELVTTYAECEPTGRFRIEVVNIHDPNATTFGASVAGIPIAQETLAAMLPNAKVRECIPDENGVARTVVRPRRALPRDIERHLRRRDLSCRCGCGETRNLDVHHMDPIVWNGESWDVRKLALVAKYHHSSFEPHGPFRLVGNAEAPGDLRVVHREDLAPDDRDGPDP